MKITRKKLLEFINSRNKKTSLIINIFTKYLYKFIIDIYENSKHLNNFKKNYMKFHLGHIMKLTKNLLNF
jgi:hypothetical protein